MLDASLQAFGIAAANSLSTADLVAKPNLWDSGFFPLVTDCFGARRPIAGPSWKMSDAARLNYGALRLGEDNSYFFSEILGLTAAEQAALAGPGSPDGCAGMAARMCGLTKFVLRWSL